MKTCLKLFVTAVVLAVLDRGFSQGTFQNLNFENPVLPLTPDGAFQVPIANALPGWRGYLGTIQVGTITYNTVSIGAAAISLQGPGSSFPPIQGNYSVILQPQFGSGGPLTPFAAIGQTGTIPLATQSLTFFSGSESMQVTFDGQPIPLFELGRTSSYLLLGGDISSFASQTGELRFTMPSGQFSYNIPYLDNIIFSPEAIPEPSVFGLLAFGTLLFGCRSRWSAN